MSRPYVVQRILDRYEYLTPEDVTLRLRYSTFVSVSKRFLYFEVPKAACTNIKEILRTLENAPPIEVLAGNLLETRRDMFIHARKNVPLPSLVDLDETTQKEVLESPAFLRMAFVRNPYTRLISAWKNKVRLCEPGHEQVYLQIRGELPALHNKSLIGFEEFIEYIATRCDLRTCNPHWRRQSDHLFLSAINFSFVGKIERMSEGLQRFEKHLGLSRPLVSSAKNVSHGRDGGIYNQSLADKVYSLYQADFEALGYDRGAWPSGQSGSSAASENSTLPEETFNDEIIERNLIISLLYQERDRLRSDLQNVKRLRLTKVSDTVFAFRKFLSNMKARTHKK